MTLYWRKEHIKDAPPGSIYVSDSFEDPLYTMVPATFEEIKAWVADREALPEIVVRTDLDSGDTIISRRG